MHLEVLLNVLTNNFEFSVLNVGKLVNDQVGILYAEVVEENGNMVIDRPLEITLLMSSGNEPLSNVIVITYFAISRIFVSLERLVTNVAVSRIVKLLLLCTKSRSFGTMFFKCSMDSRFQSIRVYRNSLSAFIPIETQV